MSANTEIITNSFILKAFSQAGESVGSYRASDCNIHGITLDEESSANFLLCGGAEGLCPIEIHIPNASPIKALTRASSVNGENPYESSTVFLSIVEMEPDHKARYIKMLRSISENAA